jgi:hypothetical protein
VKKLIFLIILLSYAPVVHADDGSYGVRGESGAVIPVRNNAITMRHEQIDIDVYQLDSKNFRIEYICQFYFENTTESKQDVVMGFPHLLDATMSPDHSLNVLRPDDPVRYRARPAARTCGTGLAHRLRVAFQMPVEPVEVDFREGPAVFLSTGSPVTDGTFLPISIRRLFHRNGKWYGQMTYCHRIIEISVSDMNLR